MDVGRLESPECRGRCHQMLFNRGPSSGMIQLFSPRHRTRRRDEKLKDRVNEVGFRNTQLANGVR